MCSLVYTLPLYSSDFPVVQDSFPVKEHTVDHACLASLDLEIISKFLCQVVLGLFCESGDLAVGLQPLFGISSEIAAQFIVFMNKLFSWAFIHWISILLTTSSRLHRVQTDDAVWIPLSRQLRNMSQSALG